MAELLHYQPMMTRSVSTPQYGNNIVQTAPEHATYHMNHQILETIRPIHPSITSTIPSRQSPDEINTLCQPAIYARHRRYQ